MIINAGECDENRLTPRVWGASPVGVVDNFCGERKLASGFGGRYFDDDHLRLGGIFYRSARKYS